MRDKKAASRSTSFFTLLGKYSFTATFMSRYICSLTIPKLLPRYNVWLQSSITGSWSCLGSVSLNIYSVFRSLFPSCSWSCLCCLIAAFLCCTSQQKRSKYVLAIPWYFAASPSAFKPIFSLSCRCSCARDSRFALISSCPSVSIAWCLVSHLRFLQIFLICLFSAAVCLSSFSFPAGSSSDGVSLWPSVASLTDPMWETDFGRSIASWEPSLLEQEFITFNVASPIAG